MSAVCHNLSEGILFFIMNTYGRLPVVLIRGNGVYVEDVKGRRYVDFISGIGVNNIGHCNPKLVENVKKQLE
ncbi:aminotransferase class III-fold pyridoxal phosphate-dependent enzyme, partial [Methanothermococcus sp. SCGC AD-155-N22]|nr:aminotransferase class III-fold pyridoxal phosphate-dependent enzyme [Methanothermococcus sp. SCGC AD-155-N22]